MSVVERPVFRSTDESHEISGFGEFPLTSEKAEVARIHVKWVGRSSKISFCHRGSRRMTFFATWHHNREIILQLNFCDAQTDTSGAVDIGNSCLRFCSGCNIRKKHTFSVVCHNQHTFYPPGFLSKVLWTWRTSVTSFI